MVITLKKKKYNFKNTLSDERLIGNYKDEIDIEISNEFELGMATDALNCTTRISHDELEEINAKFNKKDK